MRLDKSTRKTAVGVVVVATSMMMPLGSSATVGPGQAAQDSTASMVGVRDGLARDAMGSSIRIGPTGNRVEMVDPRQATYVPKVLRASDRHRAKARRLLHGVNRFCRTHTASDIKARWRSGTSRPARPTHYYRPHRAAGRLNPARPRAALVYDNRLGGVMFVGRPLPYLGTIPRAHAHHHMAMGSHMGTEMVHVYCTRNLKVKSVREAFTPNRLLGVLADTVKLRLRIRPAVTDLNGHQLRQVRAKVRGYVGKHRVAPDGSAQGSGPDPELRAMRVEIRRSLMDLREHQLRSVWRLVRSYRNP